MSSDFLSRLLIGLEHAGVKHGSRNNTVAGKTGYSVGTVNRILSGNAVLTSRFIQAVCSGFGIRREWIEKGEKPVKQGFEVAGMEGLTMPPGWYQKRLAQLELERGLLEQEHSRIETNLERYKDLAILFNRLPTEEMDDAIEVLLYVQRTKKEKPDQP